MMISLAQVIAAIAVGAMLPVTALLAVEVHRLRQGRRGDNRADEPSGPEPSARDDPDPVEEVARLASARFALLAQEPDRESASEVEARRSKAHLTLVSCPPRSGKKRSLSVPASEACRPLGDRPDTVARTHRPVRRD